MRASGTYISVPVPGQQGPRLYILTAGHLMGGGAFVSKGDGVDLRQHFRTDLYSTIDLMAISVAQLPPGKTALSIRPRPAAPDEGPWTMVRVVGGQPYATRLTSQLDEPSCCTVDDVGLPVRKRALVKTTQTNGWCMVGSDSGSTVLNGDELAGVAVAADQQNVWLVQLDLSTEVLPGQMFIDLLAAGDPVAANPPLSPLQLEKWKKITRFLD